MLSMMLPASVGLVLALALMAGKNAPPASLEQSTKRLQELLAAMDAVSFTLHYRDDDETWMKKLSPQVTSPHASASACSIDYIWRWRRPWPTHQPALTLPLSPRQIGGPVRPTRGTMTTGST